MSQLLELREQKHQYNYEIEKLILVIGQFDFLYEK